MKKTSLAKTSETASVIGLDFVSLARKYKQVIDGPNGLETRKKGGQQFHDTLPFKGPSWVSLTKKLED